LYTSLRPSKNKTVSELSLDFSSLRSAYQSGALRPRDVVLAVHERMQARGDDHVWIARTPLDAMLARADALEALNVGGSVLPLYGLPFAVKDNIDVAGMPTTAACPTFAYTPSETATVVERLLAAGAILVGKTNLDQFATGLVGTRSPFGPCSNTFDPRYVSGGSSAGSAVAVAAGLVSFALGTDTAGSGRVPAAFNNLVGLKPTRGLLSTKGVIPACRSLDCVSVFALTVADARRVLDVAGSFDSRDPYSRRAVRAAGAWNGTAPFRFGVLRADQLQTFGDADMQVLYREAVERFSALGGTPVEFDYAPFQETAVLLYDGPWVAERLAAIEQFAKTNATDINPVVYEIVKKGERFNAVDTFRAQYRLEELRRITEPVWQKIDAMLLPTAPTIYTIEQVMADPIKRNAELGYYTNFVNLLDLCALALPTGKRGDGQPLGVTLVAPAFQDAALCVLGAQYHQRVGGTLGATKATLPSEPVSPAVDSVRLAVVGAHLSGQPLNGQLIERNARLIKTCRTAPQYQLFALRGTVPPKPGLIRHSNSNGKGIEVEVWDMPLQHFGSFVSLIPAPLGIGTLTLDDGEQVKGFICEGHAVADAVDITHHGGWRSYLAARATEAVK
jgi:allophanate hydrolase